ncbi:uncharacterized protein PV06_04883 [Exophiala oligosperma]|uniref:BZIP domain-containing protein n=1 Tax=Exophiala oligosperma TaxID=215243 RepID=A0A0D2DMV9_9EURO|nr:uncharacterized protein PV06_04883 [Exophiala oligosperma]KIW43820.1 hypothetical protein PV06_04883 [Exophiala oligosperma]
MATTTSIQAYARLQYGERTYTSLESILDDPTESLVSSAASISRPMPGQGLNGILSASQYPQALMEPYHQQPSSNTRKRKASSRDQQTSYRRPSFTGAVSESNHSSSSVEPEQASPTQKKKKTTKRGSIDGADGQQPEGKKQRGRPRLDTQDETAADRRRTQIRLAQRAYRHRKETTISALKEKVTGLQNTIDQMNKTFLTLHDNMVDAGILTSHYTLGRQLQAATEEFVALAKITATDSDDEEEKITNFMKGDDIDAGAPQELPPPPSRSKRNARVDRRRTSLDQTSTEADVDAEDLQVAMTNVNANANNNNDNNDNGAFSIVQGVFDDNSNLHGLDDLLAFNATIPEFNFNEDPSSLLLPSSTTTNKQNHYLPSSLSSSPPPTSSNTIERPLKPAYHSGNYTYSFQETTFARRLHRLCLERAFQSLTSPHADPEKVKHTFRFTFCFSNRRRMLIRFQEMLKRKAGESLENWNAPFFHVGGAGLHFPRRDEDGNPIYPPNMVSPRRALVGPQPFVEVETPRAEAPGTQEMLEAIGFGGEWYDSHDVEEYLKTKGIYLDGQSSFVEVVDPNSLVMSLADKAGGTTGGPGVFGDVSTSTAMSSSGVTPSDEVNIRTPSPLELPSMGSVDGLNRNRAHDTFFAADFEDTYVNNGIDRNHPGHNDALIVDMFQNLSGPNHNTSSTAAAGEQDLLNSLQFGLVDKLGMRVRKNDGDDDPWATYAMLSRSRPPITFDVEAFLERMVGDSACLGRAPGFRKETIDKALAMSLQEGF